MYKSIIKKRKKKPDKIVLLAKTKLNITEVLISKALMDSYISYDELICLVNNVLRQCVDINEQIRNLKASTIHQRF